MPNILPLPTVKSAVYDERLTLPRQLGVEFNGFAEWCVTAFLERSGVTLADIEPRLCLHRDASMGKETYRLNASASGVSVWASDEIGVVWALTTLTKLTDGQGRLLACDIEDSPRYHHRGLMLDCARHFFSVDTVKSVIERISLAKMNVFHWHLSDDQAWRIESRQFPRLHETTGKEYYTREAIRGIVEYARVRGVDVVPEIDMPGHTTGILAAYPQYGCFGKEVKLAQSGGIYPVILCAGKGDVFGFLDALLGEVCELFPSERFHIGGDEAPKVEWDKCPDCRRKMAELGITNLDDLQGYFSNRISGILEKYGKRPVCWNETLLSANVPKNAQIQYWTLNHAEPMKRFAESGGDWIYSDMFEVYLDYPYSMSPIKKIYETTPHIGETSYADAKGLIGMEACLWTEHVKESARLEELLFPRVFALAEIAWSGAGDYEDFERRLKAEYALAVKAGVNCTPREGWNPQGEARRNESMAFSEMVNKAMSDEVREATMAAANLGEDFQRNFVTKFFAPEDIPFLFGTANEN